MSKPTQVFVQSTYAQNTVDAVKELFGENSVEYGLALSGSHDLVRWVAEQYRRTFTFDEVLAVANGTDIAEDIITLAKWHKEVAALLIELQNKTVGTENFRFWFNRPHPKESD